MLFTRIHYNVIQFQLHNALHKQVFCFIPYSFWQREKEVKYFFYTLGLSRNGLQLCNRQKKSNMKN